jgi:hypothetical protein
LSRWYCEKIRDAGKILLLILRIGTVQYLSASGFFAFRITAIRRATGN